MREPVRFIEGRIVLPPDSPTDILPYGRVNGSPHMARARDQADTSFRITGILLMISTLRAEAVKTARYVIRATFRPADG